MRLHHVSPFRLVQQCMLVVAVLNWVKIYFALIQFSWVSFQFIFLVGGWGVGGAPLMLLSLFL